MCIVDNINKEIQRLETSYADKLANEVNCFELNAIWEKIKILKKQLLFLQTADCDVETVVPANRQLELH